MAHLQYIPGDQRLVDQIVYELKSKGIFDKFRKECISDVDTRPAYQNLRQRVESSVSTFLSQQLWKPDLNKNQLREKLRKHILDGNYLEQGVERIVDQVVNPKVASVFIPQVEELVYNYLGIPRRKSTATTETSNGKLQDTNLLPTDLEAVSPGSVHSHHDDNDNAMDTLTVNDRSTEETNMEAEQNSIILETKYENIKSPKEEKQENEALQDSQMSSVSDLTSHDSVISIDKSTIPLPAEEIKLENIPPPIDSPPTKETNEVSTISNISMDIPLPDDSPPKLEKSEEKESYQFKPITSDDDNSSSDSSLRRNVSPLTPIRNYNNENSCDALQGFDNDSIDNKSDEKKDESTAISSFRFTIESKVSSETSSDVSNKDGKKIDNPTENPTEQGALAYQFQNQVNLNPFNTPMYDDSSSSNNLQIDYESDANSKTNTDFKMPEIDQVVENVQEIKPKEHKTEEKKSSHKRSHSSKESHRHSSSSREKRSDSKHLSSKDRHDSKHDKKSSKDDHSSNKSSKYNHRGRSRDRSEKKGSRDSSKHRHSSSKSSNTHKDSKSKSSSSSSQRHSSSKHIDDKKSSNHKDKSDRSDYKSNKDQKSSRDSSRPRSSHRSDKDRKSSSNKNKQIDDKDKEKKNKKVIDDHYSLSGRGNNSRRSTDRDSNDGNSSSSKGSNIQLGSKCTENKKESKNSKSDNTSSSSDTNSQSDHSEPIVQDSAHRDANNYDILQSKPVIRVEEHLGKPISETSNLIYPSEVKVTQKKPKIAANMEEAKKIMKMRKKIELEQRKMNQDAALLLEFQQNVRPGISQVYSTISGPELEFVCFTNNNVNCNTVTEINTHADYTTCYSNSAYIENNGYENKKECSEINEEIDSHQFRHLIQETQEELEKDFSIVQTMDENNTPKEEYKAKYEEVNEATSEKHLEEHLNNGQIEKPKVIYEIDDINTKNKTEYFEVTIITEVLSEEEEESAGLMEILKDCEAGHGEAVEAKNNFENKSQSNCSNEDKKSSEILDNHVSKSNDYDNRNDIHNEFHYFSEEDKYKAELERDTFSRILTSYISKCSHKKIINLLNCKDYVVNIFKEVSKEFGDFEIVNYNRNGYMCPDKINKKMVKELYNLQREITIPLINIGEYKWSNDECNKEIENNHKEEKFIPNSQIFSPTKSECSFESSDYDAKLQEMVNKTSRQEIMEIILGGTMPDDTLVMPQIDILDNDIIDECRNLKRKTSDDETNENNNRKVLTPNKIRKVSESDEISSTTEVNTGNINKSVTRSKYLGKARRVGLPKPKKILSKSPSSDKSVENYEQNTESVTSMPTVNGKLKTSQRTKIQRYDTSDLYKPKLHYLSRRNNIT